MEAVEKEANMEKEYANFVKELDEAELEENERLDNEEHIDAIEHDIEHIDEQVIYRLSSIKYWYHSVGKIHRDYNFCSF